ncbi:DNA-binding NarL/FixJ family response regulator [Dyadobacter sp. BE34]|uniref:DNA-binding NarL/FixJ family response regulator n=1 Tax=Dyadobacter fermentans TaxID=94254 RepID=A0ABU1R6V6_9BACT|nr:MULTISPECIES: response regulator transcription factor [Dyadobacter]MDR6808685.1 DNA-binding NarL/FixJ family response regulator [Dyadobacter fermentans]MDR7046428.1 DNA-binding NarL/FixJ family response regulator [Dyadobacter sp. BE242]MDR7200741.1 DNA-binding NarL/FixJ family response regulator [Dyadobacter sp. BE34]MDR7218701.1 DNA-binding NarL/FixJ family response regulator [Dyadobacter sp. BE31]MDR7266631.1 DNA-binding NarL/FixJ family response regulator [Dyadobacter sp. BE32]
MPIRILVVDDHSVVRQGIITLLEDEEDLIIAGEASDGDEVWDMVEKVKPDVILLDLTMPRMPGLEVIKQIVPVFPSSKILVFSMHNNTDYMLSSALNGASGYLEKDTSRDEMLRAIRAIAKGELYFPPYASSVIIKNLLRQLTRVSDARSVQEEVQEKSIWKIITPREQQILKCLTEGMSSKDIAEKFDISSNTVANQRASIMKKANVKNTAELISLAMK